jgi:hypothetical protein
MASKNEKRGAASGAASGAAQGFAASGGNPWGAAIGGIIGGIGGFGGGSAADDAIQLAKDQADFIGMETDENVRRMRLAAQEQVGLSRATAYSTGLQGDSGSSGQYTNKIRSQWQSDMNWARFSGNRRQYIAEKGGQTAANGIMDNMFLSNAQNLLSAGASYASQGGFSSRGNNSNPFGAPPKGGSGYDYMTGNF